MRKVKVSVLLLSVLLTAGCSSHPGAGTWTAEGQVEINKVVVTFEGRAQLFSAGREEPLWRCFWSGQSRRNIAMECIYAVDNETEAMFSLETTAPGKANLHKGDKFLVELNRQPETD
ncbi:MAG: hypothetical protein MI754_05895 [Chromatiales bacterium]|nr:hypothetical protein [Chromatiales bacterium]